MRWREAGVARFLLLAVLGVLVVLTLVAAVIGSAAWWALLGVLVALVVLGVWDLVQPRHSILRNYPVLGHMRFLLESIRPEIQQYFIERNVDGRPFDRDTRSVIYERAKGVHGEKAFGTELDVNEVGYEYLVHSTAPVEPPDTPPTVTIGGPDCRQPYEMALLNVSAMSFGALSANALRALNWGAREGGFAHDTGEGGISPYHLEHGGDLVWEIGSGYFGARTKDGRLDEAQFAEKAALPSVKCLSVKLSQGAKPGIGGVLPGEKVSEEIAETRGVPVGEKCVSPAAHREFSTPRELVHFVARMRELGDGKPVGFKLCVSSRVEVLSLCKAMLAESITPDFIIVDGGEGGTGAAPLEFENRMGASLTEGLLTVHNALVGTGLRDRIKVGASGKVATGADIVRRMIQGADYTNAARAMMMATGCIQSQRCHTNKCPVGVATQDPRRARALDVDDKYQRVQRYQQATVEEALRIIASMGVDDHAQLRPEMLRRVVAPMVVRSYADLWDWTEPGELLAEPSAAWAGDWALADPDHFGLARRPAA